MVAALELAEAVGGGGCGASGRGGGCGGTAVAAVAAAAAAAVAPVVGDPPDRTLYQPNEGATAAPARLKGDMARSGSNIGKHQPFLHTSGTTPGRGASRIRVPAA
ncbi:hypothetical protein T492DRAFT_865451 [Pavlovales sp. CCMP2436]|nr:hypothetical protein T492DRAFT_865451 [Pavlovales sp. CCMP2436]